MPAHNQGSVPLGKVARVDERGDQAIAVGKFNLEVAAARDWHAAIKFDLAHPPAVQEWSWGYNTKDPRLGEFQGENVRFLSALDITEFSPVLRGASVGTRTLSAKAATERHETETSAAPWDPAPHVRRFKGKPAELYAWNDGERVAFPHHFVDSDGVAGAASSRACLAQIASLKGDGALALSPEFAQSIYAHLAGHLEDAGYEVPSLLPDGANGVKLLDQVRFATWDVEAAVLRLREVSDARRKRGQNLADETKVSAVEMATAFEEMHDVAHELDQLVKACAPDDEVSRAIAAWDHSRARAALAEGG